MAATNRPSRPLPASASSASRRGATQAGRPAEHDAPASRWCAAAGDRRASTKPQADEANLKGDVYLRAAGVENGRKAVAAYQQALAIDPDYALAHAKLSESYRRLANSGARDPQALTSLALAAAQRASELDPDLAEAQLELANLHRDAWNWTEADARFRHAIELNPSLSRASRTTAYLAIVGRTMTRWSRRSARDSSNPQTGPTYQGGGLFALCGPTIRRRTANTRRRSPSTVARPEPIPVAGTQPTGAGGCTARPSPCTGGDSAGRTHPSLRISSALRYRPGDHRTGAAILEELRTAGAAYAPQVRLAALLPLSGGGNVHSPCSKRRTLRPRPATPVPHHRTRLSPLAAMELAACCSGSAFGIE